MKVKDILNKTKEIIQRIKFFFIDTFGWCKSLWIFLFKDIRRPGIFYGYQSYYWASKYAEKRTRKWKCKWDQKGRQQGTFPIEDIKLLVCSALELKLYKKAGIISKKLKPRKAIKKSYYTTSL